MFILASRGYGQDLKGTAYVDMDGATQDSHRNAGRLAPLTGRNIESDVSNSRAAQTGRVQFSEDVAIAGVIELWALPLQDVPRQA
ncbi:hypothetical protein [Xanthomonas oryzae]|uniref:hypothetical protein n=1 Tax=Xanthomonas oryzae TaxID=347 RepID=UPI0011810203|nr:hypothetical protein [Afipia sp.]